MVKVSPLSSEFKKAWKEGTETRTGTSWAGSRVRWSLNPPGAKLKSFSDEKHRGVPDADTSDRQQNRWCGKTPSNNQVWGLADWGKGWLSWHQPALPGDGEGTQARVPAGGESQWTCSSHHFPLLRALGFLRETGFQKAVFFPQHSILQKQHQ